MNSSREFRTILSPRPKRRSYRIHMCDVYFSACYILFVRSQTSLLQKLSSFDIKGWTNVVAPAPEQVGSLLLWLLIHFFFRMVYVLIFFVCLTFSILCSRHRKINMIVEYLLAQLPIVWPEMFLSISARLICLIFASAWWWRL